MNMQRCIRLVALIVFAAVPIFGADAPKAGFAPTIFQADDGTKVGAEMGELRVPETHGKAGSPMITLRFIRFRSTASKPGAPIVYLAGGPGGSGIGAARSGRFPLFQALRAYGDVIAFDQRGTGKSEPSTDCEGGYMVDLTRPLTRASATRGFAEPAAKCFAALRAKGIDLTAYNTRESAHDLDDLRQALGAPKITLWGISYGTFLALATLKEHPAAVDRVILAGIEGLDETEKLPSEQQQLLAVIARMAKEQHAHDDLLGGIARVSAALETQPRTVTLVDPRSGKSVPLMVGKTDLQYVIAQSLTGPETFAGLPDLIGRLEAGDWTALALASGRLRLGRMPAAMSIAMDCASGASASRRKQIAAEAQTTLLGDAINFPYPDVCASLGIPDLGDDFRKPVKSEVPALLISGTLDGRTPVAHAEELRAGMPNAVHLVIDGAGHSDPLFLSSPKILEAMKQFLAGEKVTITTAAAPPVHLIAPRKVVALTDEQLDKLTGEYRVDAKSVRKVVRLGSLLFTIRDGGGPNPIRPMSATEFFYEGSAVIAKFDVDEGGKAKAMTMVLEDGKEVHSERVR
jgi:pimeloyl-ACP methyl ester carboxylesterase